MKIKFTPEAQFEFRESVKFYEIRRKGLGKIFSQAVKATLYFIAENPLGAEKKYLDVRVTTVKKFRFTIHYHHSRKPKK